MYTRLAALAAAAILTATATSAATLSDRSTIQNAEQCKQLVEVTEQTVKDQDDIGEKARSQVAELMANLQNQCAENQFEQAEQTAEHIRGMIATE